MRDRIISTVDVNVANIGRNRIDTGYDSLRIQLDTEHFCTRLPSRVQCFIIALERPLRYN